MVCVFKINILNLSWQFMFVNLVAYKNMNRRHQGKNAKKIRFFQPKLST